MILEKFILPDKGDEKDYFISGKYTIGMPTRNDGNVPFGIFAKRGINTLDFGRITLFVGSSGSVKHLLMRIISARLGVQKMPEGLSERCLRDFLDLCMYKTGSDANGFVLKGDQVTLVEKDAGMKYVTEKYAKYGISNEFTALEYYEDVIGGDLPRLYLIEEPENGLSLGETQELAQLFEDAVKYSGAQLIISTNSAAILGIKNAVIYDFDENRPQGVTWSHSETVSRYVDFFKETIDKHKRKRNTE